MHQNPKEMLTEGKRNTNLHTQEQPASINNVKNFNLAECKPDEEILKELANIKTPFKIYIYQLPSRFNTDALNCMQKTWVKSCYSLSHCGMGRELYNISGGVSVRDSHMFSLEVVLHHKLMFSTYRTMDPEKADIFYIPAYAGLQCLCIMNNLKINQTFKEFADDLYSYMLQQPYYKSGKPHFSSIGKIQREMQWTGCPYIRHPLNRNVTYFSIEKETFLKPSDKRYKESVVSAPYPSYIHYTKSTDTKDLTSVPELSQRDVFILLAAGKRRSNPDRNKIMDQLPLKTGKFYRKFKSDANANTSLDAVFYYTDECREDPKWGTIDWMMHTVFCLQPPGDSPTRKSFFDAILSGCIPVLFPYSDQKSAWPFLDYFDYSTFTVTIEIDEITRNHVQVIDVLRTVPEKRIKQLHENVIRLRQWFQYSIPDGSLQDPDDALYYMFGELENIYNFSNDKDKI